MSLRSGARLLLVECACNNPCCQSVAQTIRSCNWNYVRTSAWANRTGTEMCGQIQRHVGFATGTEPSWREALQSSAAWIPSIASFRKCTACTDHRRASHAEWSHTPPPPLQPRGPLRARRRLVCGGKTRPVPARPRPACEVHPRVARACPRRVYSRRDGFPLIPWAWRAPIIGHGRRARGRSARLSWLAQTLGVGTRAGRPRRQTRIVLYQQVHQICCRRLHGHHGKQSCRKLF